MVSCLCGTQGCHGERCNSAAYKLASGKTAPVEVKTLSSLEKPEAVWERFIKHLDKVEPLGGKKNPDARHTVFLGSIEHYKKIFVDANTVS